MSVDFITELSVASLLLYPKGESKASRRARAFIRYDIKQARAGKIQATVDRLKKNLKGSPLEEFFDRGAVLVPVPGHAPRLKNSLWVPEMICRGMQTAGLGSEVLTCLTRKEAVNHSSTLTDAKDRPTALAHFDSIEVQASLPIARSILLVDDVVTRGATLIGAATRLHQVFPSAEIRAFALARVSQEDIVSTDEMWSPAMETIRFDPGNPRHIQRG
jgi:predicted amidophosphoribosyltransferase